MESEVKCSEYFYDRLFPASLEMRMNDRDPVSVFQLSTFDNVTASPMNAWNALKKGKQFYVEVPSGLDASSKDSLVELMELAEELGCSSLFLCLNKNNVHLADMAHVFLYLGYETVHPSVMNSESFWFLANHLEGGESRNVVRSVPVASLVAAVNPAVVSCLRSTTRTRRVPAIPEMVPIATR